jgi:hypothetical protein
LDTISEKSTAAATKTKLDRFFSTFAKNYANLILTLGRN